MSIDFAQVYPSCGPLLPPASDPLIEPSPFPSAVVVVTQAASFPGLHVVRELLSLKAHVRAVVRDQSEANDVATAFSSMGQALHIHIVEQAWVPGRLDDLLKEASHLVLFVSPRTTSFHGDAEHDMLKPAIDGSLATLQSAKRVRVIEKVVLVSSAAALGNLQLSPTELNYNDVDRTEAGEIQVESEAHRLFAACNALAERYCWKVWEQWRGTNGDAKDLFDMTSLLPVNVCGPEVAARAMRDDNFKLFHAASGSYLGGNDRSFWVDVRDVALAACKALFSDVAASNGRRYLLSASQCWLPELGAMIRMETGIPLPGIDIAPSSSALRHSALPNPLRRVPSSNSSQAPISDTAATSSEPATPVDPHQLSNLDVRPSIHDLEITYGSIDFSVRAAFEQLKGTDWGERLGIVDRGGAGVGNRGTRGEQMKPDLGPAGL